MGREAGSSDGGGVEVAKAKLKVEFGEELSEVVRDVVK